MCVKPALCKSAKDTEKTVGKIVYKATGEGCMGIAPPVRPSLTYPEGKDGALGSLCRAAEDCKLEKENAGCLPGVFEGKLYSACVDNCSIGVGAKVTIGSNVAYARAKSCVLPKPPKDDPKAYGTIAEGKMCVNSDQCKSDLGCMLGADTQRNQVKLCIKSTLCKGNFGKWATFGGKKYLAMKDDCMARKTKTGADGKVEKIKDEKINVKPTFNVKKEEPTSDGKPATPAKKERVVLKK